MNCVKESLQEEVTAHRSNNKDNENIYITFVTNFLHMFNYGVVENSLQCNECRKIFTSTENFEVLNLGFDETHNNKEKGRHSCIKEITTPSLNVNAKPASRRGI
jgi:hypothetical protein